MIKMPDWNVILDGLSTEEKSYEIGEALRPAFLWKDWQPGFNYWFDVVNNLQPLAIQKGIHLNWNNIFTDADATTPKEKACVIANALLSAFSWHESKKGQHYWSKVYDNLVNLTLMVDEVVTEEKEVWWDRKLPKRLP